MMFSLSDEENIKRILGDSLPNPKVRITPEETTSSTKISLTCGNDPKGTDVMAEALIRHDKTAFIGLIDIIEDAVNPPSGKKVLGNLIETLNSVNINKIDINAGLEVGGYFFARCGFSPTPEEWQKLRFSIAQKLHDKVTSGISPREFPAAQLVYNAIHQDNPQAIWLIADSTLGKDMLVGSSWQGNIHLNDKTARERLDNYTGKGRELSYTQRIETGWAR